MDKIRKENKNCTDKLCKYYDMHFEQHCSFWLDNTKCVKDFKSADLLPTEKVCPECGGKEKAPYMERFISNEKPNFFAKKIIPICSTCKGKKVIPINYTPEQYEEILGEPFSDDGVIWIRYSPDGITWSYWELDVMKECDLEISHQVVIVQTAQQPPPADYRPEDIKG